MRFKLGLLQDSAAQERQAKREAAEAQAEKHKHEAPTVKTEAQTKLDEQKEKDKEKEKSKDEVKESSRPKPKPKIRPLSEAKAIDSGANFVSETFLLLVGVALILGENWRQQRKTKASRADVAERIAELEEYEKSARKGLVELEKEILRLRANEIKGNRPATQARILPREVWELEEREHDPDEVEEVGWYSWIRKLTSGNETSKDAGKETNAKVSTSTGTATSTSSKDILNKMIPRTASTDE